VAEPLKHQFGADVPRRVAAMVDPAADRAEVAFDGERFVADCLDGYDDLELTPRARRIAAVLADHLPADRTAAMRLLVGSLGDEPTGGEMAGMDSFVYLPHVYFVAEHGHDDLETALELQYELTKRFTAEFSIRAFLEGPHRDATLARLREWAADPSPHVRRLVSEGTRPRLPWASRLREFQRDPGPVLELLDLLRHDPAEYVRRSVANNLNDIAKDHPDLVVDVCRRWWADVDAERDGAEQAARERWMIRHSLRTLVKQGHPAAIELLGFSAGSPAQVVEGRIDPGACRIGGSVRVEVDVHNPGATDAGALVDLRVHFVKANGSTSPKVFKGAELALAPGETRTVRRSISVRQHTTRTHHPGTHLVEVLVNGVAAPVGSFDLLA
jgi:3-methyladenine DNA glycosylase AlkC